jgi:hypothetical protein
MTTFSYAMSTETKAIIDFIIEASCFHIEKDLDRQIEEKTLTGYDFKNIIIFEDLTMFKVGKIGFIGYIDNEKRRHIATSTEHLCNETLLFKLSTNLGFYNKMASIIQEKIRTKYNEST